FRGAGHSRFGRDSVFMDVDAIPFGLDFRDYLNHAVLQCDALLAIIGSSWLGVEPKGSRRLDDARDFVRIEIECALHKGIIVVPILVDRTPMPREQDLPQTIAELSHRNAITINSGRDFHNQVNQLIRALERSFQGTKTVINSALCSSAERRA